MSSLITQQCDTPVCHDAERIYASPSGCHKNQSLPNPSTAIGVAHRIPTYVSPVDALAASQDFMQLREEIILAESKRDMELQQAA